VRNLPRQGWIAAKTPEKNNPRQFNLRFRKAKSTAHGFQLWAESHGTKGNSKPLWQTRAEPEFFRPYANGVIFNLLVFMTFVMRRKAVFELLKKALMHPNERGLQ
jgi:hypothetical protein